MVKSKTGEQAPTPQKRDAKQTKASILAAALKEFSQQGYSGARIDKIAKRAKANMRMIYHYYGNKQDCIKPSSRAPTTTSSSWRRRSSST